MLIWAIEGKTKLSTEAITRVAFSVALAIGNLTATGKEPIDALFGHRGSITIAGTVFALAAAERAKPLFVTKLFHPPPFRQHLSMP
jgi:hypothetical protein